MENKKVKIVSIISIIALALTLVTATFAYFVAQTGEGKSTDIKINANTVDTFTFETGSAISLNLTQQNFASGSGNQTGTTYAKAMLTANNKTNTATEHYYVYLNISENTFTYTQDTNTPEILLTIKDASGNAVTSISGLEYKTVTDGKGASISGFDITSKKDTITIFDNREITTTSTKTETWNITITFVNYNANQTANAGKSFNAKVLIQKDNFKLSLSDYIISMYTGAQGENGIYYHNSSLANGAGDNSYRFAGGDYQVTSKATSVGLNYIMASGAVATDGVVNMHCGRDNQVVGSYCSSTKYYTLQYDTTNTQYSTFVEALEKATTDGYLTKDNIKNFVCFGSSSSSCPEDNLYRIIGVFDNQVKLIKNTVATSSLLGTNGTYSSDTIYNWTNLTSCPSNTTAYVQNENMVMLANKNILGVDSVDGSCNIWKYSDFNTINLNVNFLNKFSSEWTNLISDTTWSVSGLADLNVVAKSVFSGEVTNATLKYGPSDGTSKVGLMYVSDYGFAAASSAWTRSMELYYSATIKSVNWLYSGHADAIKSEWTIMPYSLGDTHAVIVNDIGGVGSTSAYVSNNGTNARPVIYLKSSASYVSGSGTMSDPIMIN
ncbi:unknown [Firmicutes bacterium CAG:460]|nr:unknown [Firmicutes bacterium CAG:460]